MCVLGSASTCFYVNVQRVCVHSALLCVREADVVFCTEAAAFDLYNELDD